MVHIAWNTSWHIGISSIDHPCMLFTSYSIMVVQISHAHSSFRIIFALCVIKVLGVSIHWGPVMSCLMIIIDLKLVSLVQHMVIIGYSISLIAKRCENGYKDTYGIRDGLKCWQEHETWFSRNKFSWAVVRSFFYTCKPPLPLCKPRQVSNGQRNRLKKCSLTVALF